MRPLPPSPPTGASADIPALIETLLATERRLEELTGGEVDTLEGSEGRTFLLGRAQARVRHREAAEHAAILDALPAHVALLDSQGSIVWVNATWRRFATGSVIQAPGHEVGLNYLETCDRAWGDGAFEAHQAAEGVRSVVSGRTESFSMEYSCHSATEQRWFQLTVTPLADESPRGAVVMHMNVTERERAERALREREEHFRFLNDLGEATRVVADPERVMAVTSRMLGEHLHASRCAYADVGSDGDRFVILHDYTNGCSSTVGSYQLSQFGPRAVANLSRGQTLIIRDVEAELLAPDGGAEAFAAVGIKAIIACPLVKDGVLRAMMAVHQTTPREWTSGEIAIVQEVVERCWATIERRTAEDNLRESEGLRRIASRTSRLGGWAVDLAEARFNWSDEVCAIHDVPPGTAPGLEEAIAFYAPQAREAMSRALTACARRGTPFDLELQLNTAKGRHIWVRAIGEARRNAAGAITRTQGALQDITERKQSAEALRTSLEEFRTLAEAMPQMVWVTRPDGWNVYLNQQWMDYTGLTLEESLGYGWSQPFHPEDRRRAVQAWQRATETIGTSSLECRLRRADGVYRWWLVRGVPVRDATGNVLKWFGTCTDVHDLKIAVTVRNDAERRLLETAEEYRLLFDSNPHPMWVFDVETLAFLAVNDAGVRLYGFSREEFLGMTIKDIRSPEEVPALLEYVPAMADSTNLPAVHVKHRKKDGSLLEVAGVSNPIEFRGRRARLVLAYDVSEKKQLEAQLRQSQKMDAVGRLAGGVAHDFNNSLGVILGYTELLIPTATEGQRRKLEQILKVTNRAAGLTRQLLAFSRKQVVEPKVLDLNARLSDLAEMLRRLIGEHIELAILPGADLGQVKVDPGQLEQVVVNLCVNARDAMADGGKLSIATANDAFDTGQPGRHVLMPPGRYVMLAVSDTGCGIEKELLATIFEPFFTTKEEGKGTGLGLAMVYGIVKQAGGYIWVYSETGRGTTFKIYLPRIDEPLDAEAALAPPPSRGWETILLVEDEGPLRAIAREILEGHGYRVFATSGADEALEMSRSHLEPIHLLLTDVVMPGMNGRALAETLAAARPEMKVLYMSGYTHDVIAHSGVLESGTLLIEKPFSTLGLLLRVRAALENGARE
jgi:PAS domain S-box-containing protein